MENFVDKQLECVDCPKGKTFTFGVEEQRFFKSKNFNDPIRCPMHRKMRKQQKQQQGDRDGRNH